MFGNGLVYINYFSLVRLFLTSPGFAALATGMVSIGISLVSATGVTVLAVSFFTALSVTGLDTGNVWASLSSATVLPELSLPIMMSVLTQPSWFSPMLSMVKKRRGFAANAEESLVTGTRGANSLLVYSLLAEQLAAIATIIIKTTACNILAVCMTINFNFKGEKP